MTRSTDAGEPIEIRPTRASVVGTAAFGVFFAGFGALSIVFGEGTDVRVLGVILVLVGLTMVRGFRCTLLLHPDRAVVRGYLRDVAVPRAAVQTITEAEIWGGRSSTSTMPVIRWTTARGRTRWTPLWAYGFSNWNLRKHEARRHAEAKVALRRWAE